MTEKIKDWKEAFKMRKKYSSNFPFCFYDLAEKYLPEDKNAVVIDIGCGECKLEDYLNLWERYENLTVLDGNPHTIDKLRRKHNLSYITRYIAPNKLSFENESVDYIFCGHLIEHLEFKELYELFKEFNRVLKSNGILIINTPMMWTGFYGTFSHVKPYHPAGFKDYFYTELNTPSNPSNPPVSRDYKLEELVYRYNTFVDIHNTIGSSVKGIDFLIQISKYILRTLGIKKYTQNGYMIILRKK